MIFWKREKCTLSSMQQLTQGWILEFQLTWYVVKVILCSSCPVLVSKSFRTSILVSDCSCFHGKLTATFSAVSLPTGLIWTRFGVRRRFKRSAVRVSNRPVFRLFIWTLANVKQPRLKFSWGFTGLDYNKTDSLWSGKCRKFQMRTKQND